MTHAFFACTPKINWICKSYVHDWCRAYYPIIQGFPIRRLILNSRYFCRIWDSENAKMFIEKPLYQQYVTVWCGFWAGGILAPNFFENEAGAAVSWMEWAIEPWLMKFYGQNSKIWMWMVFISNKTALRITQVAKPLCFSVKSFQAEWFLETAITIDRWYHAI